jgi:hypothetical protein
MVDVPNVFGVTPPQEKGGYFQKTTVHSLCENVCPVSLSRFFSEERCTKPILENGSLLSRAARNQVTDRELQIPDRANTYAKSL